MSSCCQINFRRLAPNAIGLSRWSGSAPATRFLHPLKVPDDVSRLLRPVDMSLADIIGAYRFQIEQMANMIAELENAKAENRILTDKIRAWQLLSEGKQGQAQPSQSEASRVGAQAAHKFRDGPAGCFALITPEQEPHRSNNHLDPLAHGIFVKHNPQPAQNRPFLAGFPLDNRSQQRPSTCSSEVFAFKPPPFTEASPPPRWSRPGAAESSAPQQQPIPLFRGMAAPAAQVYTPQMTSPMQAQVPHHGPRASSRHEHVHMVGRPSGNVSGSRSMPTLARTEEELAPRQHVGAWHTARMSGPSRSTESPARGSFGAPVARPPASERAHARRDGLGPVGHQTQTVKKE
ncbi:U5 snRNP-specific protein [Moesziomyces antarcticus T-34]|uniref:U5 snRNP-specific protein n=1 Tax=Pseudozyma antarctica (strain T-34) TaxID=1151754 RepID=M9MCN6_PSEA3|nr:U5 snRNP-specific protein [Moesziomyces antarcticus T-34]